MLKKLYSIGVSYPKQVLAVLLVITILFASQLGGLRWETDARVYLPKGHEAIIYDEKIDDLFGVRDSFIIAIENKNGIYNTETLTRIKRVTDKIAALPGVQATRTVDVVSLSTATYFTGNKTAIGALPVMSQIPQNEQQLSQLKALVDYNADLFIGNIVSADGTAAMIRAKLKEGMANRWMTYWQVKGIINAETGEDSGSAWGDEKGDWQKWKKDKQDSVAESSSDDGEWTEEQMKWWNAQKKEESASPEIKSNNAHNSIQNSQLNDPESSSIVSEASVENWPNDGDDQWAASTFESDSPSAGATRSEEQDKVFNDDGDIEVLVGHPDDKFYLAGRPVIEVSSGTYAMNDMKIMIPMIVVVMGVVLLIIFRTARGMLLPLTVMAAAITWTMGTMVFFDVPLYTISTMLPVILVAVCIGDAVHILSTYYDTVLKDPQKNAKDIVTESMQRLGAPLIMTSLTTSIGFLALLFAEMPPFRIFGFYAMIGILYSWLISILFLPAILSLLQPKVGNYFEKRRAMRIYNAPSRLSWMLKNSGAWINDHKRTVGMFLLALLLVAGYGTSKLFINSSWMSDFREDSDVFVATKMLNEKFSGTIFLNIVIEANEKGAFKDPYLLRKMDALQNHLETVPYVGDTLSVVDYVKSMNRSLNAGNKEFEIIPDTRELVSEYLFLFSVSGRPEQLDAVVDFDYQKGLISVVVQTDYTRELKVIIDATNDFVAKEFADLDVTVNLAGSANNSYIWADLLIGSQTTAIVVSKIVILFVASLVFLSFLKGLYIVIPVTVSTLLVAGFAGVFKIPLDVSTALAAGIAIGVGVDYAVHYVFRYLAERKAGKDHNQATAETLGTTGRTIVLNAIVVTAGFSVLFLSNFPPHIKLGYFVTAYMIVSCIIAILVLPTVMSLFQPKLKT